VQHVRYQNPDPASDLDQSLTVLTKGDLRAYEQSWPMLHLHRVCLPGLTHLSELVRCSMANVITEKLESLLKDQQCIKVA